MWALENYVGNCDHFNGSSCICKGHSNDASHFVERYVGQEEAEVAQTCLKS